MKITRHLLGDRAAAAYAERHRRRGDRRRPKTRRSDVGPPLQETLPPELYRRYLRGTYTPWIGHGSRPDHRARAVALPFVVLGRPARPVQKPCPATVALSPLTMEMNYARQALVDGYGIRPLTQRQKRRLAKKRHTAGGRR